MTALAALNDSETEWIASAQAGNRGAFERLFLRYAPMVHGVLLARVSRADADDLMQDVFLTAFEKLSSFGGEQKFGAWLAVVARHKVIDAWRTRAPLAALPASDAVTSQPPRAEVNQVLAVIRSLPEAYREPLVLRLVEGLSGPEIAEQVGLTPDSVRVNLSRGMKLLRERLGLAGGEA